VRGRSIIVAVGLGGPPAFRAQFGAGGALLGHLVRVRNGTPESIADLAAYEAAANPDGGPVDSNPYGLLARSGRVVAEAGGNSLLRVRQNGEISTLAVFPSRPQGRATDSVPTAVARGPRGALYVGELTGGPFPKGGANVYRVVPGQAPQVVCGGFTAIIDLTFGPDGILYVLEHATETGLQGPGALVRVELEDGGCRRTVLASEGLTRPTSLVIGPARLARDDDEREDEDEHEAEDDEREEGDREEPRHGRAVYVSNFGTSAGGGQVVRIDL
jgi:hypothetical protein